MTPGGIIRLIAAVVAMSTQRSVSGLALPSRRPGISRNWRRISLIMSKAASPTAVIVSEAMKNGRIPPMKSPTSTFGSLMARVKPGIEAETVST